MAVKLISSNTAMRRNPDDSARGVPHEVAARPRGVTHARTNTQLAGPLGL